jgi:hypothetical protein
LNSLALISLALAFIFLWSQSPGLSIPLGPRGKNGSPHRDFPFHASVESLEAAGANWCNFGNWLAAFGYNDPLRFNLVKDAQALGFELGYGKHLRLGVHEDILSNDQPDDQSCLSLTAVGVWFF